MRATMAGVILGTAAYMSPEQVRGNLNGAVSVHVLNQIVPRELGNPVSIAISIVMEIRSRSRRIE
jgi:hypothetical protein